LLEKATIPRIVVLLLPSPDQKVYSDFKFLADRAFGIQSICVTESANFKWDKQKNEKVWKPEHELRQYFDNVAMKGNLKLGQINHTVEQIHSKLRNTLVLGADLTHAGTGAVYGCQSIAAVVGSVDQTAGKFLGSMRLQPKDDVR
jgi:eukaryotic translation initiation factor 2C